MRVYHFLNEMYAVSNLSLRRLKVSRFSQLNDPFEFLAADLSDPRHRSALTKFKNIIDKTKGMICFSRTWSNPLIWGHYADRHRGMALAFDIPNELLSSVIYTKTRVKIQFDTKSKKVINGKSISNKLMRTKFEDWKYENEHRMFIELKDTPKESGIYFVDFSESLILREVIVGHECDLPIARIKQLLKDDLKNVEIKKAGLDPNRFKVIEIR